MDATHDTRRGRMIFRVISRRLSPQRSLFTSPSKTRRYLQTLAMSATIAGGLAEVVALISGYASNPVALVLQQLRANEARLAIIEKTFERNLATLEEIAGEFQHLHVTHDSSRSLPISDHLQFNSPVSDSSSTATAQSGISAGAGEISTVQRESAAGISKPERQDSWDDQGTTDLRSPMRLREYVHSQQNELLLCYKQVLRDKPGVTGKITARFEIDSNGNILELQIIYVSPGMVKLAQLVKQRLQRWQFPEAASDWSRTVFEHTFVFSHLHDSGKQ